MLKMKSEKPKLSKKKKKQADKKVVEETPIDESKLPLHQVANIWDVISPEGLSIKRANDDLGVIKQSLGTQTFFRPFYVTREGYPRKMQTNWLYSLTSSGEIDVMVHVSKVPKNEAIRMLQKQNTIIKSNLQFQMKRGNQDSIMDNRTKIADTEMLMEEIQFSDNDAFNVAVTGTIYGDTERELNKYSEYIEDEMSSKFFTLASTWGRVKKGFRSVSPIGTNEIHDANRNLDRRALATFSPFISGSGKFNGGIPIGKNRITGQKEFYNAFGTPENRPENYNMSIFGVSGSGKSLALKLLLSRETTGAAVYSRLIDVEGEFSKIVKRLGGTVVNLSEESTTRINPLAMNVSNVPLEDNQVDEELELLENSDQREVIEKNGKQYISFVPIREKINEVLGFFDIICRGKNQEDMGLTVFERNFIEDALKSIYEQFGYSTHPSSLYEEKPTEKNGVIIQSRVRKEEPTLTDVYKYLVENFGDEHNCERLLAAIRPFLRDGSKPIFDGQTYLGEQDVDLHGARLVSFNISQMEEGFLRPIAYHVILNYIWEYFVKNVDNETKKKIVYADEFWTLVDNEQTVSFAEKVARRARKRNAGLRIASQDVQRILESPKARAVIQNSATTFFLKQNRIDLKLIEENFDLSQGELDTLFQNPNKGEGILRSGRSSIWLQTDPSKDEIVFIESNSAHVEAHRKRKEFAKETFYS